MKQHPGDEAPFFEDLAKRVDRYRLITNHSSTNTLLLFVAEILLGMWADYRVFSSYRIHPDEREEE